MQQKYIVIGLMSGTSLDGLDIACCEFIKTGDSVTGYNIINTETKTYPDYLKKRLEQAINFSKDELERLDTDLGNWMGEATAAFLSTHHLKPELIASHGHTVFHKPAQKLTMQIGNGIIIYKITGLPVVYDFRTLDIELGGQGAPLVPVGDQMLFKDYEFCLNLGGIANVSFSENGVRKAFDICACNIVFNHLASQKGKTYDENGYIAASGKPVLLFEEALAAIDYYKMPYPKSIGREWVDEEVLHLLSAYKEPTENLMHTYALHVADVIANVFNSIAKNVFACKRCRVLVTGGGAYNKHLIDETQKRCFENIELVVPDKSLVDYKEALIFGLMGLLRVHNQVNCLKSVTGAQRDTSSGRIAGSVVLSL